MISDKAGHKFPFQVLGQIYGYSQSNLWHSQPKFLKVSGCQCFGDYISHYCGNDYRRNPILEIKRKVMCFVFIVLMYSTLSWPTEAVYKFS